MAALEVAARALPLAKGARPTAMPTPTSLVRAALLLPTVRPTSTDTDGDQQPCPTYTLPPGGVVSIDAETTLTLTAQALFTPLCTVDKLTNAGIQGGDMIPLADFRDPFYASITPQAYATGAATVIAWMLVIMLIITPRTFFVGGASGRSGLMGRRGMISGATGGGSVIGVGTRPWLQKVAALTVAISLTVATYDTFKYAARQYVEGLINAEDLRRKVAMSIEIKVSRVISDVFVWLAQVQTLIRLFPRHKEKVLIKWIGFALILLDITFSCLKHFGPYEDFHKPLHFETAVPALNYLFQLSLSMLYAAWVLYYAITKRRYAFWHDMMWNISVVAVLSIVAILTPVVFFIIDLTNESIAGWGDYFRWVGAAAASVIVWEWVERIEALEREERKDGILGREIYDGDEMLETTPSHEIWPRKRGKGHSGDDDEKKPGDGGFGQSVGSFSTGTVSGFSALGYKFNAFTRPRPKQKPPKASRTLRIPAPSPAHKKSDLTRRSTRSDATLGRQNPPTVPLANSPSNRADTASVESTVYAIRYHPINDAPITGSSGAHSGSTAVEETTSAQKSVTPDPEKGIAATPAKKQSRGNTWWNWSLPRIFRPYGRSPPPEVQRGQVIEPLVVDDISTSIPQRNYAGLALRDRLGTFAAQQGERFRSKKNSGSFDDTNLPVTIIPAHPRGRTWSPEQIAQLSQEQVAENGSFPPVQPAVSSSPGRPRTNTTGSRNSAPGRTRDTQEGPPLPSPTRRSSHVRFAPEALQRPTERLQAELGRRASSLSPNAASLGRDAVEDSPNRLPPGVLGNEVNTVDYAQSRTDHDR